MPACKAGYSKLGTKLHFRVRRFLLACPASADNAGGFNLSEVDCTNCRRIMNKLTRAFATALAGR